MSWPHKFVWLSLIDSQFKANQWRCNLHFYNLLLHDETWWKIWKNRNKAINTVGSSNWGSLLLVYLIDRRKPWGSSGWWMVWLSSQRRNRRPWDFRLRTNSSRVISCRATSSGNFNLKELIGHVGEGSYICFSFAEAHIDWVTLLKSHWSKWVAAKANSHLFWSITGDLKGKRVVYSSNWILIDLVSFCCSRRCFALLKSSILSV